MLDTFVNLVGLLVDASSLYKDSKEKKDQDLRSDFSRGIFAVYTRLLDVIVIGDKILEQMEYAVRRFDNGESIGALEKNLLPIMKKQKYELDLLLEEASIIGLEMSVYRPELNQYLQVTPTLKLKRSAGVFTVLDRFSTGKVSDLIGAGPVHTSEQDLARAIKSYLSTSFPKQEIRQLSDVAERLRQFLIENFELNDILRTTNDYSFTARYNPLNNRYY